MISELSIIHPTAKIGKNVTIEPFVTIGENVEIGDDSIIMSGAKIVKNTKMGKGNKVFNLAVVGGDPQDLKFVGEETYLEIGDTKTACSSAWTTAKSSPTPWASSITGAACS